MDEHGGDGPGGAAGESEDRRQEHRWVTDDNTLTKCYCFNLNYSIPQRKGGIAQ